MTEPALNLEIPDLQQSGEIIPLPTGRVRFEDGWMAYWLPEGVTKESIGIGEVMS